MKVYEVFPYFIERSNDLSNKYFYDYFITLKELRKQKLKKINENSDM